MWKSCCELCSMAKDVGVREKQVKGKLVRPQLRLKGECLDIYSGAIIPASIDRDLLPME